MNSVSIDSSSSHDAGVFALTGVLGGFTTFSTFGCETLALARDGESLAAACRRRADREAAEHVHGG